MAEKRICPACGAVWYSADTSNIIWTCQKCGAAIPPDKEFDEREEA